MVHVPIKGEMIWGKTIHSYKVIPCLSTDCLLSRASLNYIFHDASVTRSTERRYHIIMFYMTI